jgi:DinB superfamily
MNPITLSALASFPQQLMAHYAAIPAQFKHWTPASWDGIPSEPFTAIEQICHVRDIEIEGYHVRIQRTLTELCPTLASIDSVAITQQRPYAQASEVEVLASFSAARQKTLQRIAGLSEEQYQRTAVFEGYGPLTLRSLLHYLCSHDQQHLAGLQWLMGKMQALP